MSNYQDWKKENPNKTINDFYSEFPQQKSTTNYQPALQDQPLFVYKIQPNQRIYVQQIQNVEKVDIINILVSITAILSVTLSWVDAKYLSMSLVKISGLDLHKIVKFMSAFKGSETNFYLINSFYFIPGGACLSLVGELVKREFLISFGQISNIFALGFWSYLFYLSSVEYSLFFEMLGIGYYLAVICAAVYIFKLFTY